MPVTATFLQTMIALAAGICIIVVLTARYRFHAFFALLAACWVVGLGIQMPAADILDTAKEGFGNIMKSLGLIIVLGTALGLVLQHTGSTQVLAAFIIRKTGERYAALAMSITGFITGLPVFCDSGYIVLSGLNQSVAARTGKPLIITSVALATGLYSVHCLIPPHPGAMAAAASLGVPVGRLLLAGVIIAIPAMLTGYGWAVYAGKKLAELPPPPQEKSHPQQALPSLAGAALPVVVPVICITVRSFLRVPAAHVFNLQALLAFLGEPVIALIAGLLLAFAAGRGWKAITIGRLLSESAEKAGGILVIIGAGGAFGAILAAARPAQHLQATGMLPGMGLLLPFLIACIIKTAQGSSTVAIITAASIMQPLLPALGLQSANGQLLSVLAMGAGSMMLSHANDAYFWVIAKFSGIDMKPMLKVYTLATACMGLVTLGMVYLLSLFLL